MNRICIYCGSSAGSRRDYASAAADLGEALLRHDIGLVYGGASKGLMGILADTVLRGGGHVTGVIPEALLQKEVAHTGLTEMHVVDSMHERKSIMADLSDAFIAMPGQICPTTALYAEVLVVEDRRATQRWPVAARNRQLTI